MKYFFKIYLYIFFSIILLFGVISVFFLYSVYHNTLSQEKETALSREHVIYLLINARLNKADEELDYEEIGSFVDQATTDDFMLLDRKGEILYGSNKEYQADTFELKVPKESEKVLISNVQLLNKNKYLVLTEKLADTDLVLVYVDPLVELNQSTTQLTFSYYLLVVIIILLSAIVSLVLANMLIKPITQLIKTTEAITKGDTDTRVSVSTKDELGDLGNSLNAMADKFNQDIDHIQEAKDTQDLFLANLAHEIRTPLTSISGYSQMLKWSELSEEDLESVEYIHSESERLSHLSKDILKLTQLNNYELELRNVSTNEITSDLHLFMKVNSPETLLSVNLDESNLTLDYNLFKLMTYNIMTNSLNASKNLGEMSITGKNNQDNYEFIFEDNGPGIPEDLLTRVTEAFVTSDASRNDHHLGLGLSIVKKVVELHQGTLEINNKESSGVIVRITLAKEIN